MRIKKKHIKENLINPEGLVDDMEKSINDVMNSLKVSREDAEKIIANRALDDDEKNEGTTQSIGEHYDSENIVQFHSEMNGEEPFMINGEKWVYVNVRKNDGHMDVGVYRFGHDLAYDYEWFHNNIIPKPKNNSINEIGDDFGDIPYGRDIEVDADKNDIYKKILDDINKEVAQNNPNQNNPNQNNQTDINYGEKDLPFESRIVEGKIKRKVIKKIKVKNFK